MPKRSNDFQVLVAMIQQALLPEGARVTESAMVDTANGVSREIDVLIDSSVGPYEVRIAVEAKDESRKMDIVRFESIVGKYLVEGGVRVSKVVVVARKGFSETVITRAKLLDVDLITLTEAKEIDWSRIAPPISCLSSRISLTGFSIDAGEENGADGVIECSCGRHHGSLAEFARDIFWKRFLRENRDKLLALDAEVTATGSTKDLQINAESTGDHKYFLLSNSSKREVTRFSFRAVFSPAPVEDRTFAREVHMGVEPHVCKVDFEPPIVGLTEKELLDSCRIRCSCCGKDHGTVREWSHDLAIRKYLARNTEMQKQLENKCKEMETGEAHMRAQMPFPSKYRVSQGELEHTAQTVTIQVHVASKYGELRHEQYRICKADGSYSLIDAFEAVLGRQRLRMVMPEGLLSKRISLRIDSTPASNNTSKKRQSLDKQRRNLDKRKQKRVDR